MTDPSVIQTLLMPKYQNETGPNVRKWLSDSNVKYVHEAGPYEKISAKLLLNGSHVPSDETVDCLSTSGSMRVIEGIILLYEWMVKRMLKKFNPTSMMRILELGFLICRQIPCMFDKTTVDNGQSKFSTQTTDEGSHNCHQYAQCNNLCSGFECSFGYNGDGIQTGGTDFANYGHFSKFRFLQYSPSRQLPDRAWSTAQ